MIVNAVTLSRPKKGSWSTTKSAGGMLARRRLLRLRKVSVVSKLSASLRSHTLMVRGLALMAGVGGMTMVGRGSSAGRRASSSG